MRGHRAQDHHVALPALEGVHGADPDAVVVAPYPRQRLLLRPEGRDHTHRGVLRQPRQQFVHHPPYALRLRRVAPGPPVAAPRRRAARYVDPAQRRPRIGRPHRVEGRDLPPYVGEHLQLARVAVAVDDVGDPGVAPVVLVEEQRGVTVPFGRVVRGVDVVREPVVLQLCRARPGPDARLLFLLR